MQIEVVTGTEMRDIAQPDGIEWPDDSLHVISRDTDGQLIARMSLVAVPHVEGTWIDESLRGSTAGARLLARMEQEVKDLGRTHLFAFVKHDDEDIASYLERCGYKKYPLWVYAKELGRKQ